MADTTNAEIARPWNLKSVTDTRENVIEAVQAAQFVPAAMKAALIEQINTTHPNARLIRLDVHCHLGENREKKRKNTGHWDITEL